MMREISYPTGIEARDSSLHMLVAEDFLKCLKATTQSIERVRQEAYTPFHDIRGGGCLVCITGPMKRLEASNFGRVLVTPTFLSWCVSACQFGFVEQEADAGEDTTDETSDTIHDTATADTTIVDAPFDESDPAQEAEPLPYYVQDDHTIWIGGDWAAGDTPIVVYLAGSTDRSNGATVFPFFDDFEDGVIDESLWHRMHNGGVSAEADGVLSISGGSIDFEGQGSTYKLAPPASFNISARASREADRFYLGATVNSDGTPSIATDLASIAYSSSLSSAKSFVTKHDGIKTVVHRDPVLHTVFHDISITVSSAQVNFSIDAVNRMSIDTNVPDTGLGIYFASSHGTALQVELAFVRPRTPDLSEPDIDCGTTEHGTWALSGDTYSSRVFCTVSTPYALLDYPVHMTFDEIGSRYLLIVRES